MTTTSSVLILGASGRLGSACVHAFAARGWQVFAQTRKPVAAPFPSGVTALVTGTEPLEKACANLQHIDVVVHALNPAYTNAAWLAYIPAMMQSAISIAQALSATLMFPGNVYNFGANMPEQLDEWTAQHPTTVKGKLRVDAELALMQSTQATGLRAVVIRAGDFFGSEDESGTGSMFDQVTVSKIKKGIFTRAGPIDTATPWAYLPDLAQTFVLVAERRQQLAKFEVLHFAGHHINSHDWLQTLQPLAEANGWIAKGQALKTATLPWQVMRVMGWFSPTFSSLLEMRYLHDTPHALGNIRLRKLLGTEPHTPLATAAASALKNLGFLR